MNYVEFLTKELVGREDLKDLLCLLFESVIEISDNIDISKPKTEFLNESGDNQLEMDVIADILIHDKLVDSNLVSILVSEERSNEVICNGDKFSVAYDPLDGSSLIDANFAIGTIFAVYPGTYLIGRTPRDMVASMFAVYGPRTSVILSFGSGVYEFILKDGNFELSKENIKISAEGKYFAPGNLRACSSNKGYKDLVNYFIEQEFTLRYSGGMVPDVNHIFIKGSGIFAYPKSKENEKGKLRLLYECGPMAYLIEQAGGKSSNGHISVLDIPIVTLHDKTPVFLGSKNLVDLVEKYSV
jgi:fructose-1,6-bisphosphatase